ncbi:hypothetical protein Pst134EA_032614 [Puccinia striiformis f. sp. tritici]|uniref:uncharacterized protein n=1 Tax=Puccinia striiformis f. sp. tritici TaxID=168172 RepID=UPI002008455A|nr:uncharacterized protein Pst134EA_032614 [Puccinia striiformis f. sp. tritici]KAH9441709.1 hypothetical protein Pst134EA_032614 [Puccinia striiformis f. sp. tritici]
MSPPPPGSYQSGETSVALRRQTEGRTYTMGPRNCLELRAAKAVAASSHKAAKKKKWSKGKVKDKANNHVVCDKPTYDKIFKEVPTYKMISQSVLIDRMKINGSLARVAIQHLERGGSHQTYRSSPRSTCLHPGHRRDRVELCTISTFDMPS